MDGVTDCDAEVDRDDEADDETDNEAEMDGATDCEAEVDRDDDTDVDSEPDAEIDGVVSVNFEPVSTSTERFEITYPSNARGRALPLIRQVDDVHEKLRNRLGAAVGDRILAEIIRVASGAQSKSEAFGFADFGVATLAGAYSGV